MLVGLYTEDVNAQPIFGAAASAETSEDGLTWTFKIRPHTWSDGVPVSAEDFVFAYRRILDPKTAAQYANVLYPIKNAQKVNKARSCSVRCGRATRRRLSSNSKSGAYLPQRLIRGARARWSEGNDWTKPGTMVSNGPYMLTERRDPSNSSKSNSMAQNVSRRDFPSDRRRFGGLEYRAGE
jgi:oligopeptide transport system substrate-binding protein